jgi:hypothetical protein
MKGFFTQGAALLTTQPVALREVELLLRPIGDIRPLNGSDDWAIGGAGFLVPLDAEATGYTAVDIVNRPWPDDMGDPTSASMLFAAWSTGHFGPFAYPRGLQRACQQSWAWPDAKEVAPRHRGFIRLKTSYCFGAGPDDPVVPPNYDPLSELRLVTNLAASLSSHPAVACYFNSSGETLLSPAGLTNSLAWAERASLPPLGVWSNIRFFNLNGVADGWYLMDTVGMWQLDVPDHEAFLPGNRYDFPKVDNFLRNAALYVLNKDPVIKDGDIMDGPGGVRWQAKTYTDSFTDPPREVLRWFAVDGTRPPTQLLAEKSPTKQSRRDA